MKKQNILITFSVIAMLMFAELACKSDLPFQPSPEAPRLRKNCLVA